MLIFFDAHPHWKTMYIVYAGTWVKDKGKLICNDEGAEAQTRHRDKYADESFSKNEEVRIFTWCVRALKIFHNIYNKGYIVLYSIYTQKE